MAVFDGYNASSGSIPTPNLRQVRKKLIDAVKNYDANSLSNALKEGANPHMKIGKISLANFLSTQLKGKNLTASKHIALNQMIAVLKPYLEDDANKPKATGKNSDDYYALLDSSLLDEEYMHNLVKHD
jgi:hypothetical protein